MRALILKNIDREGPGNVLPILKKYGVEADIELVSDDTDYGRFVDKYDVLVVLGGPDSANDETLKIQKELAFIQEWLELDKPYFGICLGLQLMVKALGGEVVPSKIKEVGFNHGSRGFLNDYTVKVDSLQLLEPFNCWYLEEFPVFQLHEETVILKDVDGIVGIANSQYCENQIVIRKENQVGFQFHVEVTKELLEKWYEVDPYLELEDWKQDQCVFLEIKEGLTKRLDAVIFKSLLKCHN